MTDISDDYGRTVTSGQKYMLGHFLEMISDNITSKLYKLMEKKETIFFRRVSSIHLQTLLRKKKVLKSLAEIF